MKTKKIKAVILTVIALVTALSLVSCGGDTVEWVSPMLSISIPGENRAGVFRGDVLFEIGNNDHGAENRGRIVAEIPAEGEPLVMAQFTGDKLVSRGAVKLTANFAYGGEETYNVRFRFRVDRFQGHSITQYGLGAAAGVMILWQDDDGNWWNIRRTGWGSQYTGGTENDGVFTFEINKETAGNFASQDFYVLFLETVPFRTNDQGAATDYMSGYVITYQAEMPDADGHFHNFNVLASSSIYINVPPSN